MILLKNCEACGLRLAVCGMRRAALLVHWVLGTRWKGMAFPFCLHNFLLPSAHSHLPLYYSFLLKTIHLLKNGSSISYTEPSLINIPLFLNRLSVLNTVLAAPVP